MSNYLCCQLAFIGGVSMPRSRVAKPRKLPQQDRSRLTVEAILEATTRILIEEGYDKANTNYIAERAGISVGSLYQYFPNKEALMMALVEQHSQQMSELAATNLNNLFDSPPEIAIPALVKVVIAAHAIDPKLHQVLSEEIPRSERSPQMQQANERITELLRAYLAHWRDLIQPQNLEMTIFILSCTVESLCHAAVIEHPDFVRDSKFAEEVSDLLLSYLIKAKP
jgi:AcrR family transcriptional regulator